MSLQAVARIAL